MEGVILFSDDHIYSDNRPEKLLYESLRSEMPTLGVHNLSLASESVKLIGSFKAIILDWQYSDDDTFEDIAKEIGQKRISITAAQKEDAAYRFLSENDFYSLVYIFSEKDIDVLYGESLREKFGSRIKIKKKDEKFIPQNIDEIKKEILEDIQKWEDDNRNLSIPIHWSNSINKALQSLFKRLAEADADWIKEIYNSAKNDGVDPELFVIELLQLQLLEAIVQDESLLLALRTEGEKEIPENDSETKKQSLARLFSILHYSELKKDAPLMTGDVCKINDDTFGIIVTPECDIKYLKSNPDFEFELLIFKTNDFDSFLATLNFNKEEKKLADLKAKQVESLRKIFNQEAPRLHFLPSIVNLEPSCDRACYIDFRIASKRIKSNEVIGLSRPFKINSPFIQQLRQRYISYIGRVGTPALPTAVRDWNLS